MAYGGQLPAALESSTREWFAFFLCKAQIWAGKEGVGEVQIFFGREGILLYDHLLPFFNLGLRASNEGQLGDVSVRFPGP